MKIHRNSKMAATSQSSGHFTLGFLADYSELGSNANVADDGNRKGTRSDEIRPIIRRWPFPPLRPRRAASGKTSI